MLNIQVNQNKGEAVIEASGSSIDMAAELLYVVANIYKSLGRRDSIPAEGFKMLIQKAVEDEEGPCWNGKVSGEGIEICVPIPKKEES